MARLLKMPGVSADSEEAVLQSWSIAAGAELHAGDIVASVETEKAVVDIELDDASTVHTLLVEDGATVGVGEPIAVLLEPGEAEEAGASLLAQLRGAPDAAVEDAAPEPEAPAVEVAQAAGDPQRPAAPPSAAAPTPDPAPVPTEAPRTRVFASPLARRLALRLGLDVATLTGTGPEGRVRRDDVLAAQAAAPPAAAAPEPPVVAPAASGGDGPVAPPAGVEEDGVTRVPHTRLRKLIASRLQESKRTAPHFYLTRHLRVDALFALRQRVNDSSAHRVSVNDLVVMAAARALIDVPEMNVTWAEEEMLVHSRADVSVAVASERGLVTPVVRDIGRLSVSALSATIKELIGRANDGRLQQGELSGGTLTVTNLGMLGVEEFAAIINPPQAAILAVGAATKRAVVDDSGELAAATVMTVTLSVDHRAVDGALAARWLARFAELIEAPFALLV